MVNWNDPKDEIVLFSAGRDHGGDKEAQELFKDLPYSQPHGHEDHSDCNARLTVTMRGGQPFMEIWLKDGGWMGVYLRNLLGDLAPYCG